MWWGLNMKRALLWIPVLSAALLAGCSTAPSAQRQDPTFAQAATHPFLQANAEALRSLVAALPAGAAAQGPVIVSTVVNVNNLQQAAPLGRSLAEQYSGQLARQGFTVLELKLRDSVFIRESTGELLLSREVQDIARQHQARLLLVGTYTAAQQFTFVNLKMLDATNGQILAAHDYALPNDADVRRLLVAR